MMHRAWGAKVGVISAWVIGALFLGACGGPRRIKVVPIKAESKVEVGPKASSAEAEGKVPPLKGIVKARKLVPDKLVPPEAPADPVYTP